MSDRLFKFNWYPGHIAKAERQLKEKLKLVDLVIELLDSRIPVSSKHAELRSWAANKPIITVLNKSDLADPTRIPHGIKINSKNRQSLKPLIKEINKAAEPILTKLKSKGLVNVPIKVIIVGFPNIGKSSLINALAKRKKAKVENKPGVTRQQQWVDVGSATHLKLLDTPGIIPMKFDDDIQAVKLAMCSCISDQSFDSVEVASYGSRLLAEIYPEDIGQQVFEDKKTADKFINDFRSGRLGQLSLE